MGVYLDIISKTLTKRVSELALSFPGIDAAINGNSLQLFSLLKMPEEQIVLIPFLSAKISIYVLISALLYL